MTPDRKPRWWPADEAWPPEGGWGSGRWRSHGRWGQGGRGGPGPGGERWAGRPSRAMARRFGCLILLMAVLFASIGVLVLWLLATLLGLAGAEGSLAGLARAAGLVVLVVGLVAIAFGIRFARGVAAPLTDLVDAAGRVEAGDYAVRVPETRRGPRELHALGRAFNTMTARLEADEAQRRRLLADVSHELRTPLAVIQGNLEALVDGVYPADEAHIGPIVEETRVLARLIEDLRTLSLAETGTLALHPEPTDLDLLLTEVAESFRIRAGSAGATIETAGIDDLPTVELDPIRMREVISNLVDNALRYTPVGGSVRVEAHMRARAIGREADRGRDGPDGAAIHITVRDDGPGIPPELLATVFERFAKAPESRGSGLGLAIAKAIVEAHGGAIAAESGPDAGTTIRITLPAS